MIYLILIFLVWNWGITPLWVNIAVTVCCALGIIFLGESHKEGR